MCVRSGMFGMGIPDRGKDLQVVPTIHQSIPNASKFPTRNDQGVHAQHSDGTTLVLVVLGGGGFQIGQVATRDGRHDRFHLHIGQVLLQHVENVMLPKGYEQDGGGGLPRHALQGCLSLW